MKKRKHTNTKHNWPNSGVLDKSTPTLKNIGTTLATELGEIIDRMGEDNPDLIAEILQYIKQVDQKHPDWRPVMERARQRLIGGKLGGQFNRRPR